MTDKKLKSSIEAKIEKSDEKLDSMTVLMLHYCAGLQHCLDQEELERQKQAENIVTEVDVDTVVTREGDTADDTDRPSSDELQSTIDVSIIDRMTDAQPPTSTDETEDQ